MTTPALACEIPSRTGKLAGLILRGTYSGAKRHERLGEPKCDECRLAFNAEHRQRRASNPEKDRERVRNYWRNNPEKRRENVARFRANNPERARQINRESSKRNAESVRLRNVARKARLADATIYKVPAESIRARLDYFGRKCWMCGGPYEHIEHVKPISKGGLHIPANIRPSCAPCNLRKSSKWPIKERTA